MLLNLNVNAANRKIVAQHIFRNNCNCNLHTHTHTKINDTITQKQAGVRPALFYRVKKKKQKTQVKVK